MGTGKRKRGGAGLERELTARSLNIKEQRNYRNLNPMQLDEVIFPMLPNQSSTGLILKLKTLVSKFNGAVCSGKGHHSGHHGRPLKAGWVWLSHWPRSVSVSSSWRQKSSVMISKAAFNPQIPGHLTRYTVLLITFLQAPTHTYTHLHLVIFKYSPLLDFLLDCELYQRHVTFAQRIMGNHELCTLLKGGRQGLTSQGSGLLWASSVYSAAKGLESPQASCGLSCCRVCPMALNSSIIFLSRWTQCPPLLERWEWP